MISQISTTRRTGDMRKAPLKGDAEIVSDSEFKIRISKSEIRNNTKWPKSQGPKLLCSHGQFVTALFIPVLNIEKFVAV
jgi:hypothetical protein